MRYAHKLKLPVEFAFPNKYIYIYSPRFFFFFSFVAKTADGGDKDDNEENVLVGRWPRRGRPEERRRAGGHGVRRGRDDDRLRGERAAETKPVGGRASVVRVSQVGGRRGPAVGIPAARVPGTVAGQVFGPPPRNRDRGRTTTGAATALQQEQQKQQAPRPERRHVLDSVRGGRVRGGGTPVRLRRQQNDCGSVSSSKSNGRRRQ